MGQEIDTTTFTPEDFQRFQQRLHDETGLLEQWFAGGYFSEHGSIGGFELEAWLVDDAGKPAALNAELLAALDNPLVVPELAAFNFELNTEPRALQGKVLQAMATHLRRTWSACKQAAAGLEAQPVMIGILPSVQQDDLSMKNMSGMRRYQALNNQVFKLRHGRPLQLFIEGREILRATHHDVMLEAGATSLQIHLQVPASTAHHFLNAAQIISGPMVAAGANSPYLFGHDLWDETRIPLFEQAVEVGAPHKRRVTFGNHYVQDSLLECFHENVRDYPVLVPFDRGEPVEQLSHLRFHNGTIWRWNRPLIGMDNEQPHVRIEHRVVAAGPSIDDCIANAALFYGLALALTAATPPVERLTFRSARDNFYACARYGLAAEVAWLDGEHRPVDKLLLELLPQARCALLEAGLAEADVSDYLGIIEARIYTGRNGAAWQRAWVARHGADMSALTLAYLEQQESGRPVHEWTC
jgi:gamma-glutamyl:cysteine ligase YbdK (ATP-grasp superfamily)